MRFITSLKSIALTLVLAVASYASVGVVTTTSGISEAQAGSNYWKNAHRNHQRQNKRFIRNLVIGATAVTIGSVVYAASHKSNRNQQNYYEPQYPYQYPQQPQYQQNYGDGYPYQQDYQQGYQQQSNILNVQAYFGNQIPQNMREGNYQNYRHASFVPYEKVIPLQNGQQARVTIRSEPALLVYRTIDGRQLTEYLHPQYR